MWWITSHGRDDGHASNRSPCLSRTCPHECPKEIVQILILIQYLTTRWFPLGRPRNHTTNLVRTWNIGHTVNSSSPNLATPIEQNQLPRFKAIPSLFSTNVPRLCFMSTTVCLTSTRFCLIFVNSFSRDCSRSSVDRPFSVSSKTLTNVCISVCIQPRARFLSSQASHMNSSVG